MKRKQKNDGKKTTVRLIRFAVVLILAIAVLVGYQMTHRDSEKAVTVIELDAAHGGDNSGFQGLVSEDEFCEKVTDALQVLLEKDASFQVERTHEAGTAMNADDRLAKIRSDSPDLVLSIRCSWSPDASVRGMHLYENLPDSPYHEKSAAAADAIRDVFSEDGSVTPTAGYLYYQPIRSQKYQEVLVDESDTSDHGTETLPLLSDSSCPTVVSAHLYVSSQEDADAWNNEAGIQKAAQLYYEALCRVYKQ